MSKKPNEWMPLHINSFLSKTRKLTTEEKGAYLLLLMEYWDEQAPLLNDEQDLANTAGLTLERWREISPRILRYFVLKGDMLHNKRMDKELGTAERIASRSRANGAKGGRPRKTQKKPSGLIEVPKNDENETQNEPEKNTRACKGQQSVASTDTALLIDDSEIEKAIEKLENKWVDDPIAKESRRIARANTYRGVS